MAKMFWSENHDVELLREVLAFKPYNYRKGSRESGTIWTSIAAKLNESKNLDFNVSVKSVKDHYNLLLSKHAKKNRDEEKAIQE